MKAAPFSATSERAPVATELRALWTLAVPIIAAQLGQMGLTTVDTLMVGRLSVEALDAVTLGQLWTYCTMMLPLGCIIGLDALMARDHGAGDRDAGVRTLAQALVLAAALGVALACAWLGAEPVLRALGQDPRLAAQAGQYMRVQAWSAPFAPLFVALNQFYVARGLVWPGLAVVLAANAANVGLNAVLIFGSPLNPPLGIVGAGLATGGTRALEALALFGLIVGSGLWQQAWPRADVRGALRLRPLAERFVLGLPVGLQYTLEVWAFQTGTLMVGRLGARPLAAHGIVQSVVFLTFMVPLGISIAASMRVGHQLGARSPRGAQRAAHVALGSAGAVACLSGATFLSLPRPLAGLFTSASDVIALTVPLFALAGAFQVFDALQAVGGAVLRGMGRPRPAAIFNLVGYFVLALPLGYWLTFERGLGASGVWIAYCVGLFLIATALVTWILRRGPASQR